ncbi:50S ribosomal protein L17 [Fibrella aestuarina BUZ 2]|uniref:Large ribosomal subunit protein bL17 n=1 Tax=Fibrella aestuarina BUZ 2 TaxID=1166018 RepID=I0KGQ7_9BACT|nr:50S ribosomal protein L17 [Fibrella aestuarina]CCH03310.1 50S ribosomal protein L17 [Fibrella aestuarina BUZ 2]
MRHGKKDNHLSRTHSHREAMLSNMAVSLIMHKRIETTVAKAKELRKYVEPILTRAKEDNNQNRKIVFKSLNHKEGMKELFDTVSDKIATRPGGYTRIIKLGNRKGDGADTCLIELVDFNETLLTAAAEQAATKTRRSRRGGSGRKADNAGDAAPVAAVAADEAPAATEAAPVAEAAEAPAADDLKIIEGIGPKIAELLNNAGITTFAQLADAKDEDVRAILDAAGNQFNIADVTTWNEQAALLRDGKTDEFKALTDRLKGGREQAAE